MDINAELDAVIAESERKAVRTIYKPNGEAYQAPDGSDCTVSLLGMESARVKKALDSNTRALLQAKKTKREPEDVRKARVRVAVAACPEWHGWTAGKDLAECTEANVRHLLRADHILEQFEEGINGHAEAVGSDFFLSNSTSSSTSSE